jgi:hypothetical protein
MQATVSAPRPHSICFAVDGIRAAKTVTRCAPAGSGPTISIRVARCLSKDRKTGWLWNYPDAEHESSGSTRKASGE